MSLSQLSMRGDMLQLSVTGGALSLSLLLVRSDRSPVSVRGATSSLSLLSLRGDVSPLSRLSVAAEATEPAIRITVFIAMSTSLQVEALDV